MALGETIGRAYVRILADGTGLSDDIKREMRKNEPAFENAGHRMGNSVQEGFDEEIKKGGLIKDDTFRKALEKGIGKTNARAALSPMLTKLQKDLEKEFGEIGLHAFREFQDRFSKGQIELTGIKQALEDDLPGILARATKSADRLRKQNAAADERAIADRLKAEEKLAREIMAINNRTTKDAEQDRVDRLRAEEKLAREIVAINSRSEAEKQRVAKETARQRAATDKFFNDEITRDLKQLALNVDKHNNSMIRGQAARKRYLADIEQLRRAIPHLTKDTTGWNEKLDRMHDTLRGGAGRIKRYESVMAGLANTTGRAFGKGSRNDFLNFFGSFMSIVPRLGQAAGTAAGWVAGLGQELSQISKDAGGGPKGVFEALKSLGTQAGLPGLIAALGIGITIIGTFTFALGPLTSGLVLVTGAVLALAGSLAFALVGGLVAVGGALVPFAAAIGVAALAISGMDKKSGVFKDLAKTFKDLKKETAEALFGKSNENLKSLTGLLNAIKPVIMSVAGALGDMVKSLGAASKSPEFLIMMKDLAAVLPGMVTTLGNIGGNLLTTVGNAFIAATPLIEEFLGWVEGISLALANSSKPLPGGKESPMVTFFKDVKESADIVGPLILEIIGLVGDLFGAGKKSGDNVFQGILDKVKEIRKWLDENPDAVRQWFEDAEALAGKLGEIIDSVGVLVDKLDTAENRKFFLTFLETINLTIQGLGWLVDKVDAFNRKVAEIEFSGLQGLKAFIDDMKVSWDEMWASISDSIAEIPTLFGGGEGGGIGAAISKPFVDAFNFIVGDTIPNFIDQVIAYFAALPGRIGGAIGNLATTFATWASGIPAKFVTLVTKIVNAFTGLAGKIIAKATSLGDKFGVWVQAIPGKAKTLALQIANAFIGLPGKMFAKATSLGDKFGAWVQSIPGKAKTLAGKIANSFSGLAGDMISKAGSIASKVSTWLSGLYSKGLNAGKDIARGFSDALSGLLSNINLGSLNIPAAAWKLINKTASGGVFWGAQPRIIGEAGPEAVVPLARPLSMVDPAVRELSAFAQGLQSPTGGTDVNTKANRTLVGSITIITPTEDPRAVASEVVARMAGASYL